MSEKNLKSKKRRQTRAYPKRSLMDALQIANAIKEHNAGNPYDRLDLAKAVNRTPASSEFRMLITSSGQFGLTEGSYKAKTISLTPLGRSIVFPSSPQEKANGLKTALFSIPFYAKFFKDFDNNKLPQMDFLEGTLNRTYNIPVEDTKSCYELIVKNAKELKILDAISGSEYIHLNKLSASTPIDSTGATKAKEGTKVEAAQAPATAPLVRLPVSSEGVHITVNINLELPIAKDAGVYDKIFASLKKNIISPSSKSD